MQMRIMLQLIQALLSRRADEYDSLNEPSSCQGELLETSVPVLLAEEKLVEFIVYYTSEGSCEVASVVSKLMHQSFAIQKS